MVHDYTVQVAAWRLLCISYKYFLTYEYLTEKKIDDKILI